MIRYPRQCDRLAAFYRAYERHRFGTRQKVQGRYTTMQADNWGLRVDLYPVPGPEATPEYIEAWERRLIEIAGPTGEADATPSQ